MTFDNEPDQDDLDEIVSAVVDDEASTAERSRVAADPELVAREAEFRAVASQVQAVAPADDEAREATLAAVLAVAAAPAPTTGETPADGLPADTDRVIGLAPRRAARSKRWIPAAAAVVVALLAVPALLIALNRDSSVSDVASSSSESAESTLDAAAGAVPSTTITALAAPTPEASGSASDAASTDLGVVDSSQELSTSVRQHLSASGSTFQTESTTTTTAFVNGSITTPTTTPTDVAAHGYTCTDVLRVAVSGLGDLVLTATATYQGSPVQVYGFDDPLTTGTIVLAADPVSCAILEQTTA